MLVGSGYSPDRGDYALELVRGSEPLRRALGLEVGDRRERGGHAVQMRWRDLDGLGHVNHTVVLTYLEEGRDAFLAARGIRRDEYVVGRCAVEFKGEIDPAFETVTVQCAVRDLGSKSVTTSERIVDAAGEVVVEAEFGLVLWDPERRASRPITDEERASLARAEGGADERRPGTATPWSLTVRDHGRRRLPREQPEHPVHDRGDRRLERSRRRRPGATVAHLHVREDDGTPSGRPELFVDAIDRIRAGCDVLTMVSTGGANDMTIEERTTGLEAKPDISGVESGSMNFGDETFITPPPAGRGIVERATEAGIALEVEAFDVGHVVSAVRWLEQGILPAAAADQPRLRRARAESTPPPRRWTRWCARCPPTRSGP